MQQLERQYGWQQAVPVKPRLEIEAAQELALVRWRERVKAMADQADEGHAGPSRQAPAPEPQQPPPYEGKGKGKAKAVDDDGAAGPGDAATEEEEPWQEERPCSAGMDDDIHQTGPYRDEEGHGPHPPPAQDPAPRQRFPSRYGRVRSWGRQGLRSVGASGRATMLGRKKSEESEERGDE